GVPGGVAVQREGDELGPPADRFPWHRSAQTVFLQRRAAVGAVVAIVAHQEDMVRRYADGTIPVQRARPHVDGDIGFAVWQYFLLHGQFAIALAVWACPPRAGELQRWAGRVAVDGDANGLQCLLGHRPVVQDNLPAAHFQYVAGQADHALDIVFPPVLRGYDHDVAALGHMAEHAPF